MSIKEMMITPLTNVGLTWKGNNGHTYKFKRSANPKLKITISSWVGTMAIGASHYYGRVKGDRPGIYDCDEKCYYALGGYGDNAPDFSDFSFDAKRVLQKVEKDLSDEVIGKVGDETYRFNYPQDALQAAIQLVLENFKDTGSKHWIINFEGCGPDLECVDFRLKDLKKPEKIYERVEWEF